MAVSPMDAHPFAAEALPQPQPFRQQPPHPEQEPWLADISLDDGDGIAHVPSSCESITYTEEAKEPRFDCDESVHSTKSQQHYSLQRSFPESKTKRFIPHWILASGAVVISGFCTAYSYRVLISQDALPKAFAFSPGQTVLIVNVLSHLVAFLCWTLFSYATEALRWALACRENGVELTTFLALSRATPLSGVAYLCLFRGRHQLWSLQRFMSTVMITILGLVLITDIRFRNVYTASRDSRPISVMAGLAPLKSDLLDLAPRELLSLYITAYNMGFITDPKFVTSVAPISCGNSVDCTALFLPGGLDLVRVDNENATLFGNKLGDDYNTIVIENAPGFQLEFDPLPEKFVFDPNDCKTYGQTVQGLGLYICLAKYEMNMLTGWSICPQEIAGEGACFTNTTWMDSADWGLRVSLYQRMATVAYDGKNNSILSIEDLGPYNAIQIEPSDFEKYHSLALPNVTQIVNMSAPGAQVAASGYTAQWAIGWLLKTYKDQFSTYNAGGLDLLKGFLAVSIQFNTLMWATIEFKSLPENMKATARLHRVNYRAMAQPWTVWAFGGLSVMLLSWSIGCLSWVCFYGPNSPNASMFPEIDITAKSSCHNLPKGLFGDHRVAAAADTFEDLGRLTRVTGLGNGMSKAVVNAIHRKRIYCGAYHGTQEQGSMVVIVTERGKVQDLELGKAYA